MKRVLIAVLIMMAFVTTATAENVDLASMNLEQLVELRNNVIEEINNRLGYSQGTLMFRDEQIGTGYYVVGEDINAGRYDFICTVALPTYDRLSEREIQDCKIIIASSTEEDAEELFYVDEIAVGQQVVLDLKEGNLLAIAQGSGIIRESVHTWAAN